MLSHLDSVSLSARETEQGIIARASLAALAAHTSCQTKGNSSACCVSVPLDLATEQRGIPA